MATKITNFHVMSIYLSSHSLKETKSQIEIKYASGE